MAVLPTQVKGYPKLASSEESVQNYLEGQGFELIHQGKVRDTYQPVGSELYLMVVATDRISVLDFVLPTLIPSKGEILTALTHFWLNQVLDVRHHMVLDYANIGRYESRFPFSRSLLVERHSILPFELIYRAHIGGSIWQSYLENGIVAGQTPPRGLQKWAQLPNPIFTPSTKAVVGHDLNITVQEFTNLTGSEGLSIAEIGRVVYQQAYDYAKSRGLLVLDTKLEFSTDGVLCDEVLTPDSSRYTTMDDWNSSLGEGRDPVFYDKEPVRDWARSIKTPFGVTGFQNLNPDNDDHLTFVGSVVVPDELVHQTKIRYQQLFSQLVGMDLKTYQRERMGIS